MKPGCVNLFASLSLARFVNMSATMDHVVELGFVEKVEFWKLLSHYFPSKVGGKPSWLSLQNIPTAERLKCRNCNKTCVFLLQIYANINQKEECFHRTIFLFICNNPICFNTSTSRSCIALRSQLPKVNDYYSELAPSLDNPTYWEYLPVDKYEKLCLVCGCLGTKLCSKCHKVNYCSKEHQVLDWKTVHKTTCGKNVKNHEDQESKFLLPQYELVTETEDITDLTSQEKPEREKYLEYKDFLQSDSARGLMAPKDAKSKDLEKMAKMENEDDKAVRKFKERIALDPDQVLRYDRQGEPLWVSSKGAPGDIPLCSCGAARQFEFQVMPQLISHLNLDKVAVDSIDWGTLVVYTCSKSCDIGNTYQEEYVWKQDFTKTDIQ